MSFPTQQAAAPGRQGARPSAARHRALTFSGLLLLLLLLAGSAIWIVQEATKGQEGDLIKRWSHLGGMSAGTSQPLQSSPMVNPVSPRQMVEEQAAGSNITQQQQASPSLVLDDVPEDAQDLVGQSPTSTKTFIAVTGQQPSPWDTPESSSVSPSSLPGGSTLWTAVTSSFQQTLSGETVTPFAIPFSPTAAIFVTPSQSSSDISSDGNAGRASLTPTGSSGLTTATQALSDQDATPASPIVITVVMEQSSSEGTLVGQQSQATSAPIIVSSPSAKTSAVTTGLSENRGDLSATADRATGNSNTGLPRAAEGTVSYLSSLSNAADQAVGIDPNAPADQAYSGSTNPAASGASGEPASQSSAANPPDYPGAADGADQGSSTLGQTAESADGAADPALEGVLNQLAALLDGSAGQPMTPLCVVEEIVDGVPKQVVLPCTPNSSGGSAATDVASAPTQSVPGTTATQVVSQEAPPAAPTEAATSSQTQVVVSNQSQAHSNGQAYNPDNVSCSPGAEGQSTGCGGTPPGSGAEGPAQGSPNGQASPPAGGSPQGSGGQSYEVDTPNSEATGGAGVQALSSTSSNAAPAPAGCPVVEAPSCPACPSCDGGSDQASAPAYGPCPGRGYECAECIGGWFCPPQETPAQAAPCGMGWPCYHCSSGWFCHIVAQPAPGPPPALPSGATSATAPGPPPQLPPEATFAPAPASTGSPTTTTTVVYVNPSSTGQGNTDGGPAVPEPTGGGNGGGSLEPGWTSLGCFQDGISRTLLGGKPTDYIREEVSDSACVRHCSGTGYGFAGTENGQECWCGSAIRDDAVRLPQSYCEMACQAGQGTCGGSWAISVFINQITGSGTQGGSSSGAQGGSTSNQGGDSGSHGYSTGSQGGGSSSQGGNSNDAGGASDNAPPAVPPYGSSGRAMARDSRTGSSVPEQRRQRKRRGPGQFTPKS